MDLKSGYPYWTVKDGLLASFPALDRDIRCDVVVVGAGITGSLIATSLADAGFEVVVLDRRDAGWGSTAASTALLQYETDEGLLGVTEKYDESWAVAVHKACAQAIGDIEPIAKRVRGSGFRYAESLYLASRPWHVDGLRREGELRKRNGFDVEMLGRARLHEQFDLRAPAALLTQLAGEIDPYRTAVGLLRDLAARGGAVFDRTEVERWESTSRSVLVRTNRGASIRCDHLVVAAGYECAAFLRERVASNHSTYALVTEPIADAPAWTRRTLLWETRRPYLYMRPADEGRLIIGGEDDSVDLPAKRDRAVPRKARRLIGKLRKLLARDDIEEGFAWAGTFAETEDGLPYFGPHPEHGPRVHFAMAYGGNGIVYSMIGADLIRRRIERRTHPLLKFLSFDRLR